MTKNYVFDVDGTLTPSRGKMNENFKNFFLEFIKENTVQLVTGSDYNKTVEQVGTEVTESVDRCFNCSGNSIWKNGKEISTTDWQISKEALGWLRMKLSESKFPLRTGNHIEERPGLVNFSTIGRGASPEQREMYVKFDKKYNERKILSEEFNNLFPNVTAQVAGEIGIDIISSGKDKRQLANILEGPIMFFGDKMEHDGNDYPLKEAIKDRPESAAIYVENWKDTEMYLHSIKNVV